MKPPDPAHALDGGFPSWLHIGRRWPAASESPESSNEGWQMGELGPGNADGTQDTPRNLKKRPVDLQPLTTIQ
jgi:hypothetical protein